MKNNIFSPLTELSEEVAVYVTAKQESGNNGEKPQGSATPDSNSSAQDNRAGVPVPLASGTSSGAAKSGTKLSNPNLNQWDGQLLQPGIVYYRNQLIGLPVLYIKENRNDTDRATYWQKIGQEVSIVQPIKYVLASVARAAGFSLGHKDSKTGKWYDATDDQITNSYVLIDGYGRSAGHNLELEKAQSDFNYKPFDVPVLFDNIQDPDLLRAQFISINQDVKKTNKSDLLRYADKTKQDPNTVYYNGLLKEGFVSKAAQIYAYGKELKTKDIKDISNGKTISVDADLVSAMQQSLEVYKKVFSGSVSAKILKGVPLAAWTRDKLKSAVDKTAMQKQICTKFENMKALQLTRLQGARGVKGDKAQTKEILLGRMFDEILRG